jgi:hypothetical protein
MAASHIVASFAQFTKFLDGSKAPEYGVIPHLPVNSRKHKGSSGAMRFPAKLKKPV